ncbi:MAG: c-type cytochrome, partial [Caulobacterales bacterium]
MSDLTFNKYAGAVLATCFVIAGLVQVSNGVFNQQKVAKPGFKVEVQEETGGAAAADVPPDWGTVLPAADVAAGQQVFAKCQSCHSLTANGTGPDLMGVVGRKPGTEPGYAYSDAMKAEGAKVPIWDYEHLYEYLKSPQAYVNGTKMTFVGLKQPQDRNNHPANRHPLGWPRPTPAPTPAAPPGAKAPEPTAATAAPAPG